MYCPSAQPEMKESVVLGIVRGTVEEPRVGWIEKPLPITEDLLALAGTVKPTEIFRFAAQCEESACGHFDGSHCKLATRIVQILPAVTQALPPCQIRIECRWYRQEGRAACMRCPQIVTHNVTAADDVVRAATPA